MPILMKKMCCAMHLFLGQSYLLSPKMYFVLSIILETSFSTPSSDCIWQIGSKPYCPTFLVQMSLGTGRLVLRSDSSCYSPTDSGSGLRSFALSDKLVGDHIRAHPSLSLTPAGGAAKCSAREGPHGCQILFNLHFSFERHFQTFI